MYKKIYSDSLQEQTVKKGFKTTSIETCHRVSFGCPKAMNCTIVSLQGTR